MKHEEGYVVRFRLSQPKHLRNRFFGTSAKVMSITRSSERQINERINSLKTLMNNLSLGSSHSIEATSPVATRNSPTKISSPRYNGPPPTAAIILEPYPIKQDISLDTTNTLLDGTLFMGDDDDEVKMLRENNHILSTKVMNLEDTVNNYAVEIRFVKEEAREAESKLKTARFELDQENERRRSLERDYQDEIRSIQHQIEEAHAQLEAAEQKERGLNEIRANLEAVTRELEKGNKDKADHISEVTREVNQRRIDCEDYQREVHQLLKDKKSLEETLLEERKTHERVVLELQDEIFAINGRNEDKMRKVNKDIERDKAKQNELMTHFKAQLQQLEDQVEAYRKQMIELQSHNQKLAHHANQVTQRERFLKGKLETMQEQLQQHSTQHALLHQNYMHLNKDKEQSQNAEKRLKEQIEDLNRKQEQRNDKHAKEIEKLNKELRQQQLNVQRMQEKTSQTDSRIVQMEQSKSQMQIDIDKEQEERRQEVTRSSRQLERAQQDYERQTERLQQETRILQEQNEKLREMLAQKETSYQEHLKMLKSDLDTTVDQLQTTEKAEKIINDLHARLRVLEERNDVLERKNRQYDQNGQTVTKSLHAQNELLRDTLHSVQREKEELNDKIRILTQHQREQDELLALRMTENSKESKRISSPPKRLASPPKRLSSPPKRLSSPLKKLVVQELTRPPKVDLPVTKSSAYLEREYNLSPRGRMSNPSSALRIPLIGSPSAGTSSLLLNNVNLTPTSHRRTKNQPIQRPGFLKQ
jgi:chromosome segregation ATPase